MPGVLSACPGSPALIPPHSLSLSLSALYPLFEILCETLLGLPTCLGELSAAFVLGAWLLPLLLQWSFLEGGLHSSSPLCPSLLLVREVGQRRAWKSQDLHLKPGSATYWQCGPGPVATSNASISLPVQWESYIEPTHGAVAELH